MACAGHVDLLPLGVQEVLARGVSYQAGNMGGAVALVSGCESGWS